MSSSRPQTQYAWNGEVSLAYQVYGAGPVDLVIVPGMVSHLEFAWEHRGYRRFMDRLASFARVVVYDKRGTGMSDHVLEAPDFEPRLDDLAAVLAAAGCRRPVLFGFSEGATIASLFAATHPNQVRRLVLYGAYPRSLVADDYPCGFDPGAVADFRAAVRGAWGEGVSLTLLAPNRIGDDDFRRWWAKFERLSASPGLAVSVLEVNNEIDIRDVLPTIHVSTLLLHRTGDIIPVEGARLMADRMPHARLIELGGVDHWPWLDGGDEVVEAIEEFVTGSRSHAEPDRVLATVLLTDIVGSTARAAAVGDAAWRETLTRHDALVRRAVEDERGLVIKSTGDGMLARFDRPAAALRAAGTIRAEVGDALGLEVRAGVHTGEVELLEDDVAGIAIHIAARIVELAGPGQVLVSRTVKDLVTGAGLDFSDAGEHELKGVAEPWQVFRLEEAAGLPAR